MTPDPVITVTPTIQSGTVVRWHRSLTDANQHQEILSASRDGAMIHGNVFLHDLPEEWVEAAKAAATDLRMSRDVKHLATHRRRGLMGPLEPVGPQ